MDMETERAWAAGFFDGEGGTYYRRPDQSKSGHGSGQVLMKVSQVERGPLDRFHRAVGRLGRVNGPYPSSRGYKDVYRWETGCWPDIQDISWTLWPYLGETKRAQLVAAFEGKEAGLAVVEERKVFVRGQNQ